MDLHFTPEELDFRAEARAWLQTNVPRDLRSHDTAAGFAQHVVWEQQLYAAGWSVVNWPREYGGRDASLIEWLLFEEEYYRAGGPPRVTQNGIFLLAPTVMAFGTEAQKARILRPMAAAEVLWAQSWSEPGAGSDLASTRSRARRVEGGWRLTGQKTWCTRGAFCHGGYGLFRTDPDSKRHHGLTYFLIPFASEGVTVRPVAKLDGEDGFAEVFLEDAFVSDDDVLGGVGEGWKVAMATTGSERGLNLRSPGRFMATASRLVHLWQAGGGSGRVRRESTRRDALVEGWLDAEAYRWSTFETARRMQRGEKIGAESSLNKVFWSEMDVRLHETALALCGGAAEGEGDAPDAVDGGAWMKGYQFALAGPIYAGTNEIQRNVVAERVLGLPRGPS